MTKEPQYAACFAEEPVTLGPMASATYRRDPRRLGMVQMRYNFVAKMLSGCDDVAEVGCADGFAAPVVAQEVSRLTLFDFDPVWGFEVHDIISDPLPRRFDAVYLLDVLEHIEPACEGIALANIAASLTPHGVCIIGMPSLESQVYASPQSKAGHVNCKTGLQLKGLAQRFFHNVFMFGMNDGTIYPGYHMAHYLLALACHKK